MRDLTDQERADLARRESELERFLEERMPVLVDFMEKLGLPEPAMALIDADKFLPALSRFMEDQVIEDDDRVWILTRIGYFIGEWLVQRHGGCWFLNDIPDSAYFLRYVVGQFTRLPRQHAMVDPFLVAKEFVDSPATRSLIDLLKEVEAELSNVGS